MTFRGKTVSDVLSAHKGIGPGFDFLRFGLAIFILYAHTRFIMGASDTKGMLQATQMMPETQILAQVSVLAEMKKRLYVMTVPMFFVLSGFLVTGSAQRLGRVVPFLGFRVLRILPALCVEVTLSAIVLGIGFSTLTFGDYVRDPSFWHYFGNILGINWFRLPGVFAANPSDLVNVNLWTLPAEFYCYLFMALAIPLRLIQRRRLFLALFGLASLVLFWASLTQGYGIRPSVWSAPAIVYCFFVGVVLFQWRDRIRLNLGLFLLALGLVLGSFLRPELAFFTALPLSYLVVWLGCNPRLALPFLKGRDYSYGLYLYGFPITQAILALSPGIGRPALFATALGLTLGVAALSWHLIEKPFLRLKRGLPGAPATPPVAALVPASS